MFGLTVHAPDLTEIGGFSGLEFSGRPQTAILRDTEAMIRTEFAIATTVPYQKIIPTLEAEGWIKLGHRYNLFHGPNFITLWFKHYPERTGTAERTNNGNYKLGQQGPPWSAYCCGLWLQAKTWEEVRPVYKATKWLAVWRLPAMPDEAQTRELVTGGWHFVANSTQGGSLWHTAEPLDSKNTYGHAASGWHGRNLDAYQNRHVRDAAPGEEA